MSSSLFITPAKASDEGGNPYSGAVWYFYLTGTLTPATVYADSTLLTPLGTSVTADAGGKFADIYLDPGVVYRAILKNSSGSDTVFDIDPYNISQPTFLQVGAGAVSRTMQDKARESFSVTDFGTFLEALTAASAAGGKTINVVADLTVSANTTVPNDVTLNVHDGAVITVNTGITLDIRGEVVAGSSEIFDGAGTVSLDGSSSGYNLAWFKTTNGYINERFDFAKRGMTSFNRKTLRIPQPRRGLAGTVTTGSRTSWLFNAPLIFTDAQNTMDVYVEGEFSAFDDCDAFMVISDAAKPESIFFYGSIQAAASATQVVGVGIDIKAGQRIQFYGNVLLNGFQTTMRIGSPDATGGVGDILVPMLQASFFYENALLIWGQSGTLTAQGIQIGQVNATAAQTTGLSAVKIGGVVRVANIDQVFYATDVAKDGYTANDAENVVEFSSPGGSLVTAHCEIGGIYAANANTSLKINSTAGSPSANDLRDLTIRRIWGKFNGTAANIDHCTNVLIDGVENSSDVIIGAGASRTTVRAENGSVRTITNSGSNSLINGIGEQTRGAGTPPAPGVNWPIGTVIRETGDNRLYARVAAAGTASDFIMIRGALRGTTASRPTLAATDVGQLYLDTTLDADGKPIWWTGTLWVDATGASV